VGINNFKTNKNMTTTDIQFNEKQEFETIKNIIEIKFENVKVHESISDLKYISFDFKGQNIYCSFMKDNRIYGKKNELTECSSFSSDRPNEIKTEAFRMIAKMFNCKMWENDCNEKDFEIFKAKKLPKPKEVTGYKAITQTDKNIAWFLPRPKKDRYKGGKPLYCEEWLIDLAKDILGKTPTLLNLFCGMNKYGFRIDVNEKVKPDLLCDAHSFADKLHGKTFDLIIADPPYSTEEARDIYGTPPLKYKKWTAECDKVLEEGGLLMVYHKYVMPNPNPEKYVVVKRVFIGNRTMHLPRVCIVFQKNNVY
jgi:hypothetical protein